MTDREILPRRRESETISFVHGDFHYIATLGYHPGGRLGEVFLDSGKAGTSLSIATRDAAIAASLALQHGCPVETLRGAFLRNTDGSGAGVLATLFDLIAPRGDQ